MSSAKDISMNPCDEAKCIYRAPEFRNDGGGELYCYMFKDAPPCCPCHCLTLANGSKPNQRKTPAAGLMASLLSKFPVKG
jgi:hypothetical protein